MTKSEYAQYEQSVASFLLKNDIKPGCCGPQVVTDDGETAEPFFSWSPCECCGSSKGGNRETYSFACNDGEQFEADICVDCVYYLAYGKLDDTTMMEVEQSA